MPHITAYKWRRPWCNNMPPGKPVICNFKTS